MSEAALESKQAARAENVPSSEPNAPTPPPAPTGLVAERLGEASGRARLVRFKSLWLLALLVFTAAAAVVAGTLADSEPFWASMGGVVLVAFVCLVAWVANELGALAGTLNLLRAVLKLDDRSDAETPEPTAATEGDVGVRDW